MTRNRRGFTLLEMLIAITVLGILSGVTIFSTLDMVATADAQKIINDMVQIKTAVLMWYKDNSSRVTSSYQIKTNGKTQAFSALGKEILKYIDNKTSMTLSTASNTGDYALIATDNARKWYVCCNLGSPDSAFTDNPSQWKGEEAPDARVRNKITGMVKKFGLFGKDALNTNSVNDVYTGQKFVYMLIIDFNK